MQMCSSDMPTPLLEDHQERGALPALADTPTGFAQADALSCSERIAPPGLDAATTPASPRGALRAAGQVLLQTGRALGSVILPGASHSRPGNTVRQQLWLAGALEGVSTLAPHPALAPLQSNALTHAAMTFGIGLFAGHYNAGDYIPSLPKLVQPVAQAMHGFALQVGGVLRTAQRQFHSWCERPGWINACAGGISRAIGRFLPLDPTDPRQCVALSHLGTAAVHLGKAQATQDPWDYALAGANAITGLGMHWCTASRPSGGLDPMPGKADVPIMPVQAVPA